MQLYVDCPEVSYRGSPLRFESSGISCNTNHAAGFQEELNHEEVVEVTERVKGDHCSKAILAETMRKKTSRESISVSWKMNETIILV